MDAGGRNALFMAALGGSLPILKAVLAALPQPDPSRVAADGDGPLHAAAGKGHAPILRHLRAAVQGWDVNAVNGRKDTPLHLAAASGDADAVRALLEDNPGLPGLLEQPGFQGTTSSLRLSGLVSDSLPPGSTMLVRAAEKGSLEAVVALLEAGAQPGTPCPRYSSHVNFPNG